jgi:hypothetical protein
MKFVGRFVAYGFYVCTLDVMCHALADTPADPWELAYLALICIVVSV